MFVYCFKFNLCNIFRNPGKRNNETLREPEVVCSEMESFEDECFKNKRIVTMKIKSQTK